VSGSDEKNQQSVFGVMGFGTTSTTPGSRYDASSWIDLHGGLWVFGGGGYSFINGQ
jgi:hypothetical protein